MFLLLFIYYLFICMPPLLFLQITQGDERIYQPFLLLLPPEQQPCEVGWAEREG